MDELIPISFIAAVLLIIIVILHTHSKERMERERRSGLVSATPANPGGYALLLGLALVAAGISICFIPFYEDIGHEIPLCVAFIFIAGGIAMFLYYRFAAGMRSLALRAFDATSRINLSVLGKKLQSRDKNG